MEELEDRISSITIEKAAVGHEDLNLLPFLQQNCCRNRRRAECSVHFLNNSLIHTLQENLRSRNPNRVFGAVFVIADIAKFEVGREFLSNEYLVSLLVEKMKCEQDYFIVLETCRALANMCYEHGKTQRLFVNESPMERIFDLLRLSYTPGRRESHLRFREVIVAVILNMLSENDRAVREVADNYIRCLIEALKFDLANRVPSAVSQNLFVALVTLTEVEAPENLFSLELCLTVVEMYRKTHVRDYTIPGLEYLEDSELPDIVKYRFVEAGIFEVFICILENKPNEMTAEVRKRYELMGRILSNILAGDEAMALACSYNDAEIINHFGEWLSSDDRDMIHAGALCLGNVARTDANSITIVQRGIHKKLIATIAPRRTDVKLLYALVSTLRNLCLPKINKLALIESGLVEAFVPLLDLDVRTSSPVIYKAVGSVRQVIEERNDIIVRLGTEIDVIRQLVIWSKSTILPWVSSECARFLSSLVNLSKSREVVINMIECNAYEPIVRMLIALHGLLQKEALTCLTLSLEASREESLRVDLDELSGEEKRKSDMLLNFHEVLIKAGLADKLGHLLSSHGLKMDRVILDEFLTFVEDIIQIEPIRRSFLTAGLRGIFIGMMRKRTDFELIKAKVERIESYCRYR